MEKFSQRLFQTVMLLHMANNICKDLGMAYLEGEASSYSDAVLEKLKLDTVRLDELRKTIGESVTGEIKILVERCSGK